MTQPIEPMNEPKTLTREQVEDWRRSFLNEYRRLPNSHAQLMALCDLALRSLTAPGEQDAKRLDWLDRELEREIFDRSGNTTAPKPLFRRNVPITRAAIDAAMAESAPTPQVAAETESPASEPMLEIAAQLESEAKISGLAVCGDGAKALRAAALRVRELEKERDYYERLAQYIEVCHQDVRAEWERAEAELKALREGK